MPSILPRFHVLLLVICAVLGLACAGPGSFNGPSDYDVPGPERFEAFLDQGDHREGFERFVAYLETRGVAGVVPPEQLLRQGTDWRSNGKPPFALPPRVMWRDIVPTLQLIAREIEPLVGEVEVVSAFRTVEYNAVAGGAPSSKHLSFNAVDVVPLTPVGRRSLHRTLLRFWREKGKQAEMGLGLYSGVRFHVDTSRYRRW